MSDSVVTTSTPKKESHSVNIKHFDALSEHLNTTFPDGQPIKDAIAIMRATTCTTDDKEIGFGKLLALYLRMTPCADRECIWPYGSKYYKESADRAKHILSQRSATGGKTEREREMEEEIAKLTAQVALLSRVSKSDDEASG
jgi:hypothetical protein